MISSEYCSSPFEQWYPAADFQCLSALINDNQIEYPFGEVHSKHSVGCPYVGAADDFGIIEQFLDDEFLHFIDVVSELFDFFVDGASFFFGAALGESLFGGL